MKLFYTGFILTELLLLCRGSTLFFKGLLPAYLSLLFAAGILLPTGFILIMAGVVKQAGKTTLSH
jgi:hypothetical protein